MTMGIPFLYSECSNTQTRKEALMSNTTSTFHKLIQNRHVLAFGLIMVLSFAVSTAFVAMQTDHLIAPPGLRLLDGLWRLFFCR